MTSRNSTTHPAAMIGTWIGLPDIHSMTSTAGAISEATASSAIRQPESRASVTSTGSATRAIDGSSAAVPHRTAPISQPASTMCPVTYASFSDMTAYGKSEARYAASAPMTSISDSSRRPGASRTRTRTPSIRMSIIG